MIAGRIFTFWSLVIVTFLVFYAISTARSGRPVKVRQLPALEAIPEAIGRSVEMGRPVLYNLGIADIVGDTAAQTVAGLVVLSHVSKLAAEYGTKVIVPIRMPTVLPLAEEAVRNAYALAGKADRYDPNWVQYMSQEQWAFVSGVMGITQRERPGANIMIGGFWSETLLLVENGNSVGAIQIGGTGNLPQVPFFVAACDYTLIGEEIYAAGAVASQDPVSLGSIDGQDLAKIYALALVVVGAVLATLGSPILSDLIKL